MNIMVCISNLIQDWPWINPDSLQKVNVNRTGRLVMKSKEGERMVRMWWSIKVRSSKELTEPGRMRRDMKERGTDYQHLKMKGRAQDIPCKSKRRLTVDIVVITEVMPKAQVHPLYESSLSINGYKMIPNFEFRTDNPGARRKRGIIVYASRGLLVTEVKMQTDYNELVWIKVRVVGRCHMLLGCVYRSPNSPSRNSQALVALLREVGPRKHSIQLS